MRIERTTWAFQTAPWPDGLPLRLSARAIRPGVRPSRASG